ncbi:hypothetical protein AZA_88961 [Nitrospirillum viridazoti Y2]|uniref:Uncharacterized protein DUF4265 n=1 Tax=Nitrospirillum amazonense TaxID=28077 RepID=A0A560HQ17_9PROT|nr:DUF4265 domain-containing protein [Nitrospirillum amazonense]EGY01115.1 hypothetical protein AZA_88961 [Nitrospirillum amazonense Y2]TWB48662.1 uncharacterized protein DUF4265 [Nitrospirillum amazonense]
MDAKSAMVKLSIPTDPADWHGVAMEHVWATPLGDDLYVLENSPGCAYGVSYRDIVVAQPEDGLLLFQRVHTHQGHSTYRIRLAQEAALPDFQRHWQAIGALGCTFEGEVGGRAYTVDVPPATDVQTAYALMQHGEELGIWLFEESHYGGAQP